MNENRRQFSRVEFKSEVFIIYDDLRVPAQLTDISLKGALISPMEELPMQKDEICQFELNLSESNIVLSIESTLVYKHEENYGLKFSNIDLDSMMHLRRLVELNVGDPDQVQKELFFLVQS